MRFTVFEKRGDEVGARVVEKPEFEPFTHFDGAPLRAVQRADVTSAPGVRTEMVHIAAGGHFVMHASPDVAVCNVIRGRGELVLPQGEVLGYEAPELYVFLPDTLHEWRNIEADTLLSTALVEAR
ncbi:hypothetical protein ER308_14485 [Egibacter rhizosphaerae]|uniref:Cupin domain-containing protein n=1 Tax=Egibacter rhizosphaerae TaxID=1670831 RepID=A0A411YH26_9ACTN|nr:hypothetical protein [Egibacter rhizosphaerae]QBI20645.1 hypothetical protein ER308_14485 [Egibacter rhizosphaerae]